MNRSIEDIDILKRFLYFSGFNFSDKDSSPGFVSLPYSIAAHQSHTSLMKTRVMLSTLSFHDRDNAEDPAYQFHTSPMKTEVRALSSHYWSSLSYSFHAKHILKLILYCSYFNFSCKDLFPGFPSLPLSASAHRHQLNYTNSSHIIFNLDKFNSFWIYRLNSLFKCIIPFSSVF